MTAPPLDFFPFCEDTPMGGRDPGIAWMHVISQKKLREFWAKWPEAETPLRAWHRVVQHATWGSFAEVRQVYANADQVGRWTVFNIGGNKFRLVAAIHFNRQKVYIRHVMTHAQYDKGAWKEDH